MQDRSFNSFASNMIQLSANETKWSILLARTRALILFTSIWIYDFGPEKLSGLWRNAPGPAVSMSRNKIFCSFIYKAMGNKYYQMRTWYIQVKFIWSSIAIVTSPIIHLSLPDPPPQILHKHFLSFLLGRL